MLADAAKSPGVKPRRSSLGCANDMLLNDLSPRCAAPVAVAGGSGDGGNDATCIVHAVKMSDTFTSVSLLYGVTPAAIRKANGFRSGDRICSRREVRIPHAAPAAEITMKHVHGLPPTPPDTPPRVGPVAAAAAAAAAASAKVAAKAPVQAERPTEAMDLCKLFLSKCDREIACIKDMVQQRERSGEADATPIKQRLQRLHRTTMMTTRGKLRAEDQAQDEIERLLLADPEPSYIDGHRSTAGASEDLRTPVRTDLDADNELFDKDGDIYEL